MADELSTNLSNYKLQLQQVEAALTTDAENEELQKLRKDLHEVIELTEELIENQKSSSSSSAAAGPDDGPGPTEAAPAAAASMPEAPPARDWKVGEKCRALFSDEQQYYEATIDDILEDGSCTVTFAEYGNTDVTQVSLLRSVDDMTKRPGDSDSGPGGKKTKKDKANEQREYKKKKAQKKAQRMRQLDEEREGEKNKWISFNTRVFAKTNKGRVKKSIFATPDHATGRVGVGTCGLSGKPMTDYQQLEKWKK